MYLDRGAKKIGKQELADLEHKNHLDYLKYTLLIKSELIILNYVNARDCLVFPVEIIRSPSFRVITARERKRWWKFENAHDLPKGHVYVIWARNSFYSQAISGYRTRENFSSAQTSDTLRGIAMFLRETHRALETFASLRQQIATKVDQLLYAYRKVKFRSKTFPFLIEPLCVSGYWYAKNGVEEKRNSAQVTWSIFEFIVRG